MVRPYLVVALSLIPMAVAGQTTNPDAMVGLNGPNMITTYRHNYGVVLGHPYLQETWTTGTFRTVSGRIHSGIPMKYDAYAGLVSIRTERDSLFLRNDVVVEFEIEAQGVAHRFRNGFDTLPDGGDRWPTTRHTYLEVLHEGSWSLYRDVRKVLRPSDFDARFQTGNRFDSLEEVDRYLVRKPDGEFVVWAPSRRNLTRLFGRDLGRLAEGYASRTRLNYDRPFQLAGLFEFVNRESAE